MSSVQKYFASSVFHISPKERMYEGEYLLEW